MHTFTLVFILALILTTLAQWWLAARHIRHITAHRNQVPDAFVSQIDLAAHQKAADYTCAKARLSFPGILLHAGLLLVLTLGGGLEWLSGFWHTWFSDSLWHGMVLIFSVVALLSIVEIPFSYYRTFVIEQQYGFNKMTRAMFLLILSESMCWAHCWERHCC